MSWHDLIDDASVKKFVSGESSWAVEDFTENETGEGGVDEHSSPRTLYDTDLLSASEISADLSDSGITIVPSVPSYNRGAGIEQQIAEGGNVSSGRDVAFFSPALDSTELSLHPSSVASSVLTENSIASSISEISASSSDTPFPSDRHDTTSENARKTATLQLGEDQLKKMYIKQNKSEQSWEENKEKIIEVLQALDSDHKDPDHLLAQLYAEEEAFFQDVVQRRKARDQSAVWFEVATIVGFLGLAAAVLVKIVKR